MADKNVYTILSRQLQKWLRYDIKHVKTGIFHPISGLPTVIFLISFFDRF